MVQRNCINKAKSFGFVFVFDIFRKPTRQKNSYTKKLKKREIIERISKLTKLKGDIRTVTKKIQRIIWSYFKNLY